MAAVIENFHFIRPWWLVAMLPLIWILYRCQRKLKMENQWQREVDPALLSQLLDGETSSLSNWPFIVVGALWLLAVVALAGPSWERLPTPVFRGLQDRVLVVDLSRSMNAADIKPSRIERLRQKLNDVLDRSADTQTALIVYSAASYVVTPLTDDVETIRSMLPSISTEIVPAQGSRTSQALEKAFDLLQGSGNKDGSIWLFTDSLPDEPAAAAAQKINRTGYHLSIMGLGTHEGAPIPKSDGGFYKDKQGNIVVVKLIAAPLQKLAAIGGGVFTGVSNTDLDIVRLFEADIKVASAQVEESEQQRTTDVWHERGPWIVLFLMLPVALLFRRGWL